MQRYYDTVTDQRGNALAGARVAVQSGGSNVSIYSDNGVTQKTNPMTTDANGGFSFYAANGTYDLVVTSASGVVSSLPSRVRLFDVADAGLATSAALAASSGASLVGFVQSGAGAVARTAQDKGRETVSATDFYANGVSGPAVDPTGVLDSTLGVQAAAAVDSGKTYKITDTVSLPGNSRVFENTTLDMSDLSASADYGISCAGTQGAAVALTANTLQGTAVITVGSTASFTTDYAWLESTTAFESSTNTPVSQMVKIKSVDSGTQITLHDDVLYDFTTVASSTIAPLSFIDNITLRNVTLIGSGANTQAGLNFDKCSNLVIENCRFRSFDFTGIRLNRCLNVTVRDNTFEDAQGVGLSYGVVVGGGSYNCTIDSNTGFDLRHLVSVGDNTGINLFVRVVSNHAHGSRDAGIDSHPASDHLTITGNTVECAETAAAFSPRDGIIVQGRSCVIANNTVVGARNYGILYETYASAGHDATITIGGNTVKDGGPSAVSASGVRVVNKGAATIKTCIIGENTVDSADLVSAIHVYADTGDISNLSITGNVIPQSASSFGVYVQADAGNTVSGFSVSNNKIKSTTTTGIFLFGATAPNILEGVVSGNSIPGGGTYGVRYIYCQGVTEYGNRIDAATSKNFIDTGSVSIDLDRRQSAIRTTTNSASTVADQDRYLIVNRAGTHTMTLPDATAHSGREITIKTVQAQEVVSASANVVPADDVTAGTAILPATDGAWAMLKSDGTNWVVLTNNS
jgi:hypothetical protein